MRLRVSGDKSEIRQSYIPSLFPHLVQPLMDRGAVRFNYHPSIMRASPRTCTDVCAQNAVDDTIDMMDEYFLTREDWDTIVELGVGDNTDAHVLKKISTATKTAFTKKYNSRDHPVAFHKAEMLGKAPKKLAAAGPAPDLEEAFDVSFGFCPVVIRFGFGRVCGYTHEADWVYALAGGRRGSGGR